MAATSAGARVAFKNILFATDFSEASEAALPFALTVARRFDAKLYTFHMLTPMPYDYSTPMLAETLIEAQEDAVRTDMRRLESQLTGVPHEAIVELGLEIWPVLEREANKYNVDLLVFGTHGRTGGERLLLGSVAEEVFRRSTIPVLTIGPQVRASAHNDARFHCVLFPTDFTPESLAAAPLAISLAQENQAKLVLLHVIPERDRQAELRGGSNSVADAMGRLHDLVPEGAELWCRPETIVQFGKPFDRILDVAADRKADLIVLGVRGAKGHLGAATHIERATAHNVVVQALCPVLTVRQQ
jgi:nucleotide-binding universal stress UspA family protein